MKLVIVLGVVYGLVSELAAQKNNNFVAGRNTIVQLFEWKWDDIAAECENFLGPKGFAGVQISPPNENQVISNRPWWERYQPVSYQLKTRSGDKKALASMINRCNKAGVRIYADAVINHMAAEAGTGTAGNKCRPGCKCFPAIRYSCNDFHETCAITNYHNATIVRNCELLGLKDLDQSSRYVRRRIVEFLNELVDLGVAGFRVDAAKHMWPVDLATIYTKVKNLNTRHGFPRGTRPFFYQEVIDLGGEVISKNEYTGFGAVLEFKYGFELSRAFQDSNQLKYLKTFGPGWGLLDGGDAVCFIDNHDNQRGNSNDILTYKKSKPYKMANAFMLAFPYGTTRIMSSFDFNDDNQGPPNIDGQILSPGFNKDDTCTNGWVCEHRWRQIYNMVLFRNAVAGTSITNWWSNDDGQIAFGRGDKGFIAFTLKRDINRNLQTSLPAGQYCDLISGKLQNGGCTGKTVNVDNNGQAAISLSANEFDGVIAISVVAKK